mgnify:CR=1 FL=1
MAADPGAFLCIDTTTADVYTARASLCLHPAFSLCARGDQFGPGEPLRDAKIALEEARVFDWRFQL